MAHSSSGFSFSAMTMTRSKSKDAVRTECRVFHLQATQSAVTSSDFCYNKAAAVRAATRWGTKQDQWPAASRTNDVKGQLTNLQHAEALGAQVGGRAGGRPGGAITSEPPVLPLVVEALQRCRQASWTLMTEGPYTLPMGKQL